MYNQKRNNRLLLERRKQQLLEEISQEVYLRIICEQHGIDRSQLDEAGVRDTLKGLGLAAGMTLAGLGGVKGQAVQPPISDIEQFTYDTARGKAGLDDYAKDVSTLFTQRTGMGKDISIGTPRLNVLLGQVSGKLTVKDFDNFPVKYKGDLDTLYQDLKAGKWDLKFTHRLPNMTGGKALGDRGAMNRRPEMKNPGGADTTAVAKGKATDYYAPEEIDLTVDFTGGKADTIVTARNYLGTAYKYNYTLLKKGDAEDQQLARAIALNYSEYIARVAADMYADHILRIIENVKTEDVSSQLIDYLEILEDGENYSNTAIWVQEIPQDFKVVIEEIYRYIKVLENKQHYLPVETEETSTGMRGGEPYYQLMAPDSANVIKEDLRKILLQARHRFKSSEYHGSVPAFNIQSPAGWKSVFHWLVFVKNNPTKVIGRRQPDVLEGLTFNIQETINYIMANLVPKDAYGPGKKLGKPFLRSVLRASNPQEEARLFQNQNVRTRVGKS